MWGVFGMKNKDNRTIHWWTYGAFIVNFEHISHFIYIHTNFGCHDKMSIKIYINNKTANLSFGKNENRHQSENNIILWWI